MKSIGLYLHIPFCIKKCNYCDFVSYSQNDEMIDSYVKALLYEIKMYSDNLSDYKIETIFIGGGTPSILKPEKIDKITNEIFKAFNISENPEFTIESNPGTLTDEKLKIYKDLGINRLSMGLQSFNDDILRFIGRIHSKKDFLENYYLARNIGFKNINVDLIYGLPNQTSCDWEETLKEILKLDTEHVSAYSLKIEEGTVFKGLFDQDKLNLPDEDEDRNMYHLAIELLNSNGINQYEISNFSKPGYQCKHNLIYWNNKNYLGLGVSAHSYLNACRYANTNNIWEYIDSIKNNKYPVVTKEPKTKEDEMTETVFLNLRLKEGLGIQYFKDRFNKSIFEVYGDKIEKLDKLGLITIDHNHIMLTKYGVDVSNQVFVEFL
ncbi:radical SAM family heme chaperone HemW [Maledivibacter halophilus]|uniref:Heme chaperone HemW n=1 Tax=Maledivibacter halophilus TaxID=36842 RepID=A0A1T5LUK2_9FIRM|nr:radical SAM family heme chaperone HemW [Maledivibacter halophilus]SKC79707.1 oxygen-independent coproporphyrinogen-3 oxidase [Maledivibacter halophilus]